MTIATSQNSELIVGLPRLHDLWKRYLARRKGVSVHDGQTEKLDRILIDGLSLAIEETTMYLLQQAPSFTEFEKWILERNDGHVSPLRVERINCAINQSPYSKEINEILREIDEAESVLTGADLAHWNEQGYVIVRDVITKEEARASEDAVWQFLGMDRHDPETWYRNKIGKRIMTELYHHPVLNKNRTSKRIHKTFAQIWGTADLWMTTDRTGFNPPETWDFRFPGPRLHWDMNLTPPLYFGVQGLIYLNDVAADQGAFTCVPGFHKILKDWLTDLPRNADPRKENLDHLAVPISANAGDLIIWHQFLPHGSSPNRNTYPRLVQYLTMYPAHVEHDEEWR